MYLYKFEGHCNDINKDKVKLELVFIKHNAPNSLPLTVNNHHVLFVKRLLFLCFIIFSKSKMIFFLNLIR